MTSPKDPPGWGIAPKMSLPRFFALTIISRQQRSVFARVGDVVFTCSYIHTPSPREHVLRAYFTLGGIFWVSLIYFLFL